MDPREVLRSSCGKANFQRVARLLISGGTSLLREIFDVNCPPSQLLIILSNPATKKVLKAAHLTKPQWNCLYPSPGVYGKSTDFDITLLSRLLRTICSLTPPTTGWDALPAKTNDTLTADLVRIKCFRNSIYGHVNQAMEITDEEFQTLWQEISGVLVRIAGQISHGKETEWQVAIDKFLKEPLTQNDERNVQELERWYKNDMDVKKAIEDLQISTEEGMGRLEHKMNQMAQDFKDQVEKVHQSIGRASSSATGGMAASTINAEVGGQHDQTCIPSASKTPVGSTVDAIDARNVPYYAGSLAEIVQREKRKIRDTKDGTPSILKLQMKEELTLSRSMICRQSIGEPGQFQEKVLLVVGALGAGKSTLVNGMVNYIMGVKWEDDFRFKVTVDEQQTNYITAYTFHPVDGSPVSYTFTVIDTPGFGATEGLKKDKEITLQIKKFFSIPPPEGIDHLDGIAFVIQASQARLTPTQEYIFHAILSIFGKDVSQNIFMMLTFADGQRPAVLEAIKKAQIPSQSDKHFKFNNSALLAKNDAKEGFGSDKKFWKMNLSSLNKFFVEFPKSECVSLRLTKKVLKEREQLHLSLEGLDEQIQLGLDKIEEIRQEEIVLQQHENEIEANKNFTFEINVTKPIHVNLEGTGQHTTTCVPCHKTCHKNCRIPDDRKKFNCWDMGEDGKCKICPRGCIWSEHKNLPYLIEHKVVTETRTLQSLKSRYQKEVQEKATARQMMDSLEESLQNVHVQVLTMIKQAQQSVRRLEEIALKPNPLTEVDYIEVLIESEKRSANAGWKQRVKYYEVAKRHAQLLSEEKVEAESEKLVQKLSRQVLDVSEETTKALEKMSLDEDNSDKWYSRFKF